MDHAIHGGRMRWWSFAIVLAIISVGGLFVPDTVFQMDALSPEAQSILNKADIAWMITATALVMLMTPGLSFFYGGMVRKKNVISTMTQSVIAMGLVSVLWVVADKPSDRIAERQTEPDDHPQYAHQSHRDHTLCHR